ncbi:ComGF family competence protein [Lentibacillus sp. N15]
MVTQQNESGFTFLTLLVTVTILFMILPFASYFLKSVDYPSHNQEIAVQQFFYFLRDDVLRAKEYTVPSATQIRLINEDNTIVTIEQYKDLVRRQVGKKGHEIYLRDVQTVSFEKLSYGVQVTITSLQGETYEKTIVFYP